MVQGVVRAVERRATKTGRNQNYVTAVYTVGEGFHREATLNLRSVLATCDVAPSPAADGEGLRPPPPPMMSQQAYETPPRRVQTTEAAGTQTAETNTATATNETNETNTATNTATNETNTTTTNGRQPTVVCHDREWFDDPAACLSGVGQSSVARKWLIRDGVGGTIDGRSVQKGHLSRMDFFLLMMPPRQLELMTRETNTQLLRLGHKSTTTGELLKMFGVLILITKYQFASRASLWATVQPSKYVNAANFGRTGMSRNRFDVLWRCIRFGEQPVERPEGMTSEKYRWLLVDAFVENFNNHRATNFEPGTHICCDESISRWYGMGGDWINEGLPMYVAIDRKPENGCEIQNVCCGDSGIMIQVRLVKTSEEESTRPQEVDGQQDGMLPHGGKIMFDLIRPWLYSRRIICADSYFSSVATATEALRLGVGFIGVVKTATRQYPMAWLQSYELGERGDRKGLVSYQDGKPTLLSYAWVDRERRYFISNTLSLSAGQPFVRKRWRQVDQTADASPEKVELLVQQPKATEVYYSVCSKIDRHNRNRQDTLRMERKVETRLWWKRVGTSLLSMVIVDTWLAYSQCILQGDEVESQDEFYGYLAEELIDNSYDTTGTRGRQGCGVGGQSSARGWDSTLVDRRTGMTRCGTDLHLTPTKRRRRSRGVEMPRQAFQRDCRVCKTRKSKFICSTCFDEKNLEVSLCHSETGRNCFALHVDKFHS